MGIVDKRIIDFTGNELLTLLKENGLYVVPSWSTSTTAQPAKQETNYVYGIAGLARLIGCSNVTAQKIKNSGKIDGCYSQFARKLVFNADAVIERLKK